MATIIVNELHLVLVPADGRLLHTIRSINGWDPMGDVKGQAGQIGTVVSADAALIGDALHVCAVTQDGRLWHTIRDGGAWQPFGDVKASAGQIPAVRSVSLAAAGDGIDLYVLCVAVDGQVHYAVRHPGSWDAFAPVPGATNVAAAGGAFVFDVG